MIIVNIYFFAFLIFAMLTQSHLKGKYQLTKKQLFSSWLYLTSFLLGFISEILISSSDSDSCTLVSEYLWVFAVPCYTVIISRINFVSYFSTTSFSSSSSFIIIIIIIIIIINIIIIFLACRNCNL